MTTTQQQYSRPPLEPDEHAALDRLSEALGTILDLPERRRASQLDPLLAAVKAVLEAFGEDWSEEVSLARAHLSEVGMEQGSGAGA